jgi:aspartyl-tRNA(Asn)/glutamyl-tRNA(Gln) amidotransferase subunit A
MTANRVPDSAIGRLHDNLRAAGVPAQERDVEGLVERGFLSRLADFEQLVERLEAQTVPDYLGDWGARSNEDASPASLAPAGGEIGALAEQLHARQVSPVELTEQALARIAERDSQLNAFQLVLAERARAAARRAEQEIAAGAYRGPLHGVPVAVKDLLAMRGTRTTGGSKILADNITDFDAAAVERLEAAGAVIVGKTRLSEFAYSPGSNNAHYGSTHNPRDHARDTGGSSSGSGAAVADGLVIAALGTDTGGSIRIPACFCGIVGLKPTFGRISLYGVLPLAWSLDHLGPMTRTVADAALLLDVLAGEDARDPRARQVAAPGASAMLDAGARGLRIGVLGGDGSGAPLGSAECLAAWRAGLAALEGSGAQLVPIDLPEMEDLRLLNGAILALEALAYHLPNLRARLDDYGEFMRQRILAAFAYGPGAFVRAQQARAALRRRCEGLFERFDLLSTPTQPDVAPQLGTPGWTTFTGPFNLLGWPAVTVPIGSSAEGLPFGLQLAGKPWDEATVLRAARAVEVGLAAPGRA